MHFDIRKTAELTRLVIQGSIRVADLEPIFDELLKRNPADVLDLIVDLRNASLPQLSFNQVETITAQSEALLRIHAEVNEALIIADAYGFATALIYQSLARSRRHHVRIFDDEEVALAWLRLDHDL